MKPTPNIQSRRGFTLTEILIVIGLIVLIMALAVPAFNAITGSRSVDAGENLVAAMLGRARAEAIRNHRVAGVAIFYDRASERTAMAIVVPSGDRNGVSDEPAGLEQYKSWKPFLEDNTTPTHYEIGDVVIALVNNQLTGKKTVVQFVCKETHDSANDAAHRPPDQTNTPPTSNTYWGPPQAGEYDTLVGYEYQYLPKGVGAQTINDPDPSNSATQHDRYLRNGIILFDGDGSLLHAAYIIRYVNPATTTDPTHLYLILGFDKRATPLNTQDVGAAATNPIYSQFGVVLYDEQEFIGNGGTQDDPMNDDKALGAPGYNEGAEELWLDNNSLSLMINRYNGTLVRGE